MNNAGVYRTKTSDVVVELPLFIPVYRPDFSFDLFNEDAYKYGLNAVMVNAFLLYRNADRRKRFQQGYTLREHIGGFKGLLCTDSGAFQQLRGGRIDLDSLEIVKFQNTIQTDVAAPLDLLTPPETNYEETCRRMQISHYRIEESLPVCDYSDLAAIQQGGGYFSLRQKHIRQLKKIGFAYYGIGSMVPFFNKNHDLAFTCRVIKDARDVIGYGVPMHVYGAGDPLDIAFMYYAGANVFDSSSYAHYARRGYYMTPYGAVDKRASCERLGFVCTCPICRKFRWTDIMESKDGMQSLERHNLFTILDTIRRLARLTDGQLEEHIAHVHDTHVDNENLFPHSQLASSWERYLGNETIESVMETPKRTKITVSLDREEKKDEVNDDELASVEDSLLKHIAEECAVTYKIEPQLLIAFLKEEYALPRNAVFRSRIQEVGSLKDILRLGDYKAFRKSARAGLYQNLRRYKPVENHLEALTAEFLSAEGDASAVVERILSEHISTRERLPDRRDFINTLERLTEGKIVIDIGCGFNPMLFPADFYRNLSCYIAVDKDAQSVEMVRLYAQKFNIKNLQTYVWDIGDGLCVLETLTGKSRYDFALALKIVPVLYRVDRACENSNGGQSIPFIGEFPTKRMLATVCRESMTKRRSIEKRELATLRRFIDEYGFYIESEVSFGTELGFVIGK